MRRRRRLWDCGLWLAACGGILMMEVRMLHLDWRLCVGEAVVWVWWLGMSLGSRLRLRWMRRRRRRRRLGVDLVQRLSFGVGQGNLPREAGIRRLLGLGDVLLVLVLVVLLLIVWLLRRMRLVRLLVLLAGVHGMCTESSCETGRKIQSIRQASSGRWRRGGRGRRSQAMT